MKLKKYTMFSVNLQKKMRKQKDSFKVCIKTQKIISNAEERGIVYQILRHAEKCGKKRIT